MIEYSEFQCPYCAEFERETWPIIKSNYVDSGALRVAFRHFPLAFHPLAQRAAESASCAGLRGRFWEMHDRLFAHLGKLSESVLKEDAQTFGLSDDALSACLASSVTKTIQDDVASGKALGVSGTPTFFFGLADLNARVMVIKRMDGAKPTAEFIKAIDSLKTKASGRS